MYTSAFHVALQDDGGGNLIDQGLVSTTFSPDAAIKHRLVSQDGGEALVVKFNRDIGKGLCQLPGKAPDAGLIFGGSAIRLNRESQDEAFHLLMREIVLQKRQQGFRFYGGQSIGNQLQGVAHSNSRPLFSIVDGKQSHDFLGDSGGGRYEEAKAGTSEDSCWLLQKCV